MKKIIITSFVLLATYITISVCVVLPAKERLRSLRDSRDALGQKIVILNAFLENSAGSDGKVDVLQNRLETLKGKFPSQEEESLNALREIGQRNSIDIKALQTQPKREECADSNSQKIMFDQKACQRIRVSLTLQSTFDNLVGFIEKLNENLPALMTVEKLNLNKTADLSLLNVLMDIDLYFLSP